MTHVSNFQARVTSDKDDQNPPGGGEWYIVKDKDGDAIDFNKGAKGEYIYLFCEMTLYGDFLSALRFVKGESPSVKSKWHVVNDKDGNAVDFNKSVGGEYIYLYYSKVPAEYAHIGGVMGAYGKSVGSAMSDFPEDYVVLRQDTNQGSGGKYVFLGYIYND